MDKILFSYASAVVFYIIFASIVMFAQAGINCSNLTSVCPNRPVVLTCNATRLPIQWKCKNCTPELSDDIVLFGNSVKGSQVHRGGFVATVVEIENNFVLTSLKIFPNSSCEHHCKIRCEYENSNDTECIINIQYIKRPLVPIEFKIDSNRYGIVTLSWKYDNNSIVEHAYLSVQSSSDEDMYLGETYIVDGRNNYTVAGIQANTTYIFFLTVENCMGSNGTNITMKTEPYSPATPEFDICTILHNNVSNITTIDAKMKWKYSPQEQNADYYKLRVIGKNKELILQKYFATSYRKSHFVLPNEGIFTVEVSALNEYGESQPKSKKLIFSSNFLKVEAANMTMTCCVESLSSNANCTIIIKRGGINQSDTNQFDKQGCTFITIPGALYHHDDYLSYEAYIDGDPDICYRIIYNGNSGVMEPKGSKINVKIIVSTIVIGFLIGFCVPAIVMAVIGKAFRRNRANNNNNINNN